MNNFKCRRCGNDYSNQEEYFDKSSRYKSGFDTLCKSCKSKIDLRYRKNNVEKINERRKIKYDTETKPISHELYVNKMLSDPITWRAQILRQGMRQRSRFDNLVFDSEYFTVDKIKSIITERSICLCCKVAFSYVSLLNGSKNASVPSADRYSNDGGYTQNNVVFLCWRCNNLKRDSTVKDLQTVVNWLERK